MKFKPTAINGVFEIELEPRGDDRGFFARAFCEEEFADKGLETRFPQMNASYSAQAGTLRGLHYQIAPHGEAKLIRCIKGAIFDVFVDLRAGSPTFGRWASAELSAENRRMFYAPKGCAHAYMTLTDGAEVLYSVSTPYAPQAERIIRWDDLSIAVAWPRPPTVLSDKDRNAPFLDAAAGPSGY